RGGRLTRLRLGLGFSRLGASRVGDGGIQTGGVTRRPLPGVEPNELKRTRASCFHSSRKPERLQDPCQVRSGRHLRRGVPARLPIIGLYHTIRVGGTAPVPSRRSRQTTCSPAPSARRAETSWTLPVIDRFPTTVL